MKIRKIKKKHILIIGSGHTLLIYKNEIKKFIKKNEVITFGSNNIIHLIVPDYHFWTDSRRYSKFGKNINKKSIFVFGNYISKKMIREHWKGSYNIIKYKQQKWKKSYEDPTSKKYGKGEVNYKDGIIGGAFRTSGCLMIFYAYLKKAFKISVVGMDGYTLYSKEELKSKEYSQHCYGKGFTDFIGRGGRSRGTIKNFSYKEFIKKDEDISKTLYSLQRYGVKFEILTPTVHKEFYNSKILNINEEK